MNKNRTSIELQKESFYVFARKKEVVLKVFHQTNSVYATIRRRNRVLKKMTLGLMNNKNILSRRPNDEIKDINLVFTIFFIVFACFNAIIRNRRIKLSTL